MLLAKNSKFLLVGDSITDGGRVHPMGEGWAGALGTGYVALVEALLSSVYYHHAIRVVNMGSSGDTVRDFRRRWKSDVLDQAPDWVSVMVGINDVSRQFDAPTRPETHVYIDEYESTLNDLIEETHRVATGMILMTPFFIEPNRDEPMRAQMDRYGDAVKRLALRHDLILVDTQAAFDELLGVCHPSSLAPDRVHANLAGHMVITRALLNAIGFLW
ncbi:MAG: SGNH/GDSL hydrolase family protein [Capsulimonadaceae bacterium]